MGPGRPRSEIADQVRRLTARGLAASTIAAELGVSRQRVYQIAKNAGIRLAPPPPRGPSRPIIPISRVITGGVPVPINASIAGTIAELLVAADLLARGWQPYVPAARHGGHDLIAYRATDLATIEVRSGYRNRTGRVIYNKSPRDNSTHYAVVITGEPVLYDPPLPS